MAFSDLHMLFQWGGPFGNTGGEAMDQFVGSLRFSGPDLLAANNDATAEALLDVLAGFWVNQQNYIPRFAKLGWAKWNLIGTNGRYNTAGNTRLVYTDSNLPGGVASGYPLQIAWCTTWLSTLQRGRASKGRTYWPTAVPVTEAANMRVGDQTCIRFAQGAMGLIRDLNAVMTEAGSGARASIMSNIGEGTSTVISGVQVGNRLDIQRRRDNATDETYYRDTDPI